MAYPPVLVSSYAKLKRAADHFDNLKAHLSLTLTDENHISRATFEPDPHRGHDVLRLHFTDEEVMGISLIAGDIVHNLRCALDHIAWGLYCASVGNSHPPPDRYNGRVAFPIFNDAFRFQNEAPPKMLGFPDDAKKLIEKIQPYHPDPPNKIGKSLWRLHGMDNRDKHHRLNVSGFKIDGSQLHISMRGTGDVEIALVPIRLAGIVRHDKLSADVVGIPNLSRDPAIRAPEVRAYGHVAYEPFVDDGIAGEIPLRDALTTIAIDITAIVDLFARRFFGLTE